MATHPVTLSILVPLYNEEQFVVTLLDNVIAALSSEFDPGSVSAEIIVVDDASTDHSFALVQSYIQSNPAVPVRLIRHLRNRGKGAAVRSALQHATGSYSIIQDADLEYDPREYPILLRPLLSGHADAVFGSRFVSSGERRVLYFWHSVANRILTTLASMASDLNLSDVETCYKAFRTSLAKSIPLRSNRFGIDPELVIKFAKRQARVYEVPISYRGRTYDEGKKIRFPDAFAVLGVILRNWLINDLYTDDEFAILDAMSRAPRFNRWMADVLSPFLGHDILEIGAGTGNLTRFLAPRGRSYVATDIDSERLLLLQSRLRYRPNLIVNPCDITKAGDVGPYRGSKDSVLCLNVLEHTANDADALRNIFACLRPGGRAIVLVPQGPEIFGSLDQTLHHQRRYRSGELVNKMALAGFTVEKVLPFNRPTYPGWFVNGRILKRRRFGRCQLFIFDSLVPLWRRVDAHLPWPPTSLIAIGRRDR